MIKFLVKIKINKYKMNNNLYRFDITSEPEHPSVPYLFEIWNWVGDTSILPIKWLELLKKSDLRSNSSTFSRVTKEALMEYVRSSNFDPYGFFFLTTRSETTGGLLVWKTEEGRAEIKFLAVLKEHRSKGVGESLIMLAKQYCYNQGIREIYVSVEE
jgi:ribosomal protein S18 acetylase RimI-like enzyme